ncbi:hypothetical protein BH11VER1_BH11VER1_34720 [soil metagenome]
MSYDGKTEFGTVVEGHLLHADLKITNIGKQSLTLKRVEASCGCLVASMDVGQIIAPKASAPLAISFDTSNREGEVRQQVRLVWQEEGMKALEIPITAMVLKELAFHGLPSAPLVDTVGEPAPETVLEAEWLSDKSYEITSATAPGGHVSIKLETVEAGKRYRVKVTPSTSRAKQSWQESIVLTTTHPNLKERVISLSGMVRGRGSLEPSVWNLGRVILGGASTQPLHEFAVKVKATRDFNVTTVDASAVPGLTVDYVRDTSDTWTLHLRMNMDSVTAQAKARTILNRKVIIQTDLPDEDALELPVLAVFDAAESASIATKAP